jgi:ABC-type phosphate transport system substrate-binding protein
VNLRIRTFACAAALGAAGVVGAVAAPAALAGSPGGTSCAAGINGRGSTLQGNALQNVFGPGFQTSVCGGGAQLEQYNYANAVAQAGNPGGTGSGNGQKAANCRTDAFSGTDIPYTEAVLAELDGTPGNATLGGCGSAGTPFPYNNCPALPAPCLPASGFFPAATDTAGTVMQFPVAVGAVTISYNLPASCTGSTKLSLTGKMVSQLFGGEILTWQDAKLRAGGKNAFLAGASCDISVRRVVRNDKSGTTQIFKNYLVKADDKRKTTTCSAGTKWDFYAQDANNQVWPNSGTCSTLDNAGAGNGGVATEIKGNVGAVGYVDLSDANARGLKFAKVKSKTAGFASPFKASSKKTANCDIGSATLPDGGSANGMVGLVAGDNWGTDNPSGNHGDVTDVGAFYPICGLTWDFVYAGQSSAPLGGGPVSQLSLNQRQTLYDFFSYVLSAAAQTTLNSNYYEALPASWASAELAGFQSNF